MIKRPNRVLGDKKAIRRNFAKRRKAVLILATDIPHIKFCECSNMSFSRLIYPSWSLSQRKLNYSKTDRMLYSKAFNFTKISRSH